MHCTQSTNRTTCNAILFAISLLFLHVALAQVDSIDVRSNKLKLTKLRLGVTSTYLVYFQHAEGGPKYRMEIWERIIRKNEADGRYEFSWNRYGEDNAHSSYQILASLESFEPLREDVTIHPKKNDSSSVQFKSFIYKDNSVYTDPDKHSHEPFRLDGLNDSFNWEMDMETLGMLPLKEGKTFAISFYHPGSNVLPEYHIYTVDRAETLDFSGHSFDCWVLKNEMSHDGMKSSTEFWIDKKNGTTLKVKDAFGNMSRFKMLIIN